MKKHRIQLSACTACGNLAPLGGRNWCQRCTDISTIGVCVICSGNWYFCPKKDYGQCNQEEYDAFVEDPHFICNDCLEKMRCKKCGCDDDLLLLCDGEGCRAKDRGYAQAVCLSCSGETDEPEHYYCEDCKQQMSDAALVGQKYREKARLKGRISLIQAAVKKGEDAYMQDGFTQVESEIQRMRNALIEKLKDDSFLATPESISAVQTFGSVMQNAASKKRERQEKTDALISLKKQRQELDRELSSVQAFLNQEKKKAMQQ